MKTTSGKLLLAALLCMFSLYVRAAPTAEDIVRVPTVTRLVKVFTQLEVEIIKAIKQKDKTTLTRLIDQNFEMQVAIKSADSVPLSAWINTSMSEGASYSYDISDMAVRDLGQTAIVTFDWKYTGSTKQNSSPEIFIVDVWKKVGEEWKLALRFSSADQKSDVKFPGFSLSDGVIEKKY